MTTMRATALPLLVLTLVLGVFGVVDGAAADQRSESLRREAYDAAYNMDYERAVELFQQAVTADPNDAAAWRGAASAAWLRILFLRGTVLVEDYLGRVRDSGDVKMPTPPAELDQAFHRSIEKAIALGEKAVNSRYRDPSAHYDLSAALGLAASYSATVEGKVFGAMKLARRSVSESEMAVSLDKNRKETGLVLGTYRYIVSALPMAVRWMAYIVGFSGGKEEGIRLIEEASRHPSDIQADARFALVLMYNRERRYADAVKVIRSLEQSYPRNRLLFLEEASTELRNNRPAEALGVLDEAMARLPQDVRPRMPGEEVRWHLKRGTARMQVGRLDEAEQDLRTALAGKDARAWVRSRLHIELGKVADLRGDRAKAKSEYTTAAGIAAAAGDDELRNEAERLQSKPYKR